VMNSLTSDYISPSWMAANVVMLVWRTWKYEACFLQLQDFK